VEVANDKALLLTDRFIKKEDIDPVRTRLELKELDEKLDHFKGDPTSAEYAELVERELWAAAQLELHGDPPPARIRNVSSLGAQEDYSKTATAEDDGTSLEDTEKH
jgi:F-type H+-transporting ATPase subunit epsilon